jgi:predicted enzyme related to lactoylglutathione lyase
MTEQTMTEQTMTDQTGTSNSLNTVTWWEIPASDLSAAKDFYGTVFGWTFTPFGEGYLGIMNGADLIGGLWSAEEGSVGDGIRVYVNVADIETTLAAVESAGGSVATARQEVGGDMGWWASFKTPDGRLVGLCSGTPAS